MFHFSYGEEANLPVSKSEGHLYGCTDSGNAFFDFISSLGTLVRMKLCADKADKLRYEENGVEVELLPTEIATKTEMAEKVSQEQGVTNYGKVLGVDATGIVKPLDLNAVGGLLTWGALKGTTSNS